MKKIFITFLVLVIGVFATPVFAHAGNQFNNDSRDLGTVMVANDTQNPCSAGAGVGCWRTSVSARPGDIISVMVYYHNTSNSVADTVALGINPRNSSSSTTHTFEGGILVYGWPDDLGSATVHLSESAELNFIPGSVRWFPNQTLSGQTVSNESALFSNYGFTIGNIAPGWSTQGSIVARFRVGSGDGNGDSNCRINSFDADDYSIDEGDEVELSWDTSGCDSAKINQGVGSVSLDGDETVDPRSTTTYTLSVYDEDGDLADTDTVRIVVDEDNNDSCSIDSFKADDYSIDSGDSTVLRWSTTGADDVDITPGYANRSDDGSVTVRPSRTTTYTLTASCDNGNERSRSVTISVDDNGTNNRPQAITTIAAVTSSTTASLNGIAVTNTSANNTRAWFEWGPSTSLGYKTATETFSSNGSYNYATSVSGLVPGTVYYYRAVVENTNGISYGELVRFQSRTATTTPPTTIVRTQVVRDTVVAQSAPSLLELRIDSAYDRMCVSGTVDYTVTYRNISGQRLDDTVLQINHQKEVTFISSSRGNYDVVDRTVTVDLGDVAPGETGTVLVRGKINSDAVRGNLTVMTAQVVYTNTQSRAQESAIAYSLITISEDCPNVLGASAFGFGSFLPDTLIEWLLLVLIILALIVLGRQLYKKKQHPTV